MYHSTRQLILSQQKKNSCASENVRSDETSPPIRRLNHVRNWQMPKNKMKNTKEIHSEKLSGLSKSKCLQFFTDLSQIALGKVSPFAILYFSFQAKFNHCEYEHYLNFIRGSSRWNLFTYIVRLSRWGRCKFLLRCSRRSRRIDPETSSSRTWESGCGQRAGFPRFH
jgi:hypothetical protein